MIRPINLKNENKFQAILYKNRRLDSELAEIPSQYVTNISFDVNNYATMTIEIPSQVVHNNETVDYFLYEQIKGKMIIIVTINDTKYKFIVDEDIDETVEKSMSKKVVKAYTYEKTLIKKNYMLSQGLTRQLYRPEDETVEVSDGILNLFEQSTNWKVGHVDVTARKELGLYNKYEYLTLFENYEKSNIEVDSVLWEKNVTIDLGSDKAISMSISYPNMETYKGEQLQKRETLTHKFDNLPYPVKHIKATYTSDSDYRYGVTYEITYNNNTKQSFKYGFAYVTNLQVVCKNIELSYDTLELEELWKTKYRYFSECSTNWFNFLMNEVSEAFECIFIWDSYNQTVHAYDKKTFGDDRGLALSWEFVKTINKKHKIGDVVTRLNVSSTLCSISEENPLGTEYVESYLYYKNSGIMSDSLSDALDIYDVLLEEKQIEFLTVKLEKNKVDQKLTKCNSELTALQERYKTENALLTAYIKAEDSVKQSQQSELVKQLDGEIQAKLLEIQTLKDESNRYLEQMTQIGQDINRVNASYSGKKIFTEDDLLELDDYTVEGTLSNDYYTLGYSLYNHALEMVEDANTIFIDFSLATYDFLSKIRHKKGWDYLINIGSKIELDDKDVLDNDGYVQLYGFDYSPKNKSVSNMKFTNNKQPKSSIKTIADIGRTVANQTTMTDFYKNVWLDSKHNNINVNKLFTEGLDLTAQMVRGKTDISKIDISEAGIFIIDAIGDDTHQPEDKQIFIGNSTIAISDDRWKTSKTAVTSSGIIADTLISKLILSEKMHIGNEDNTFTILPDGLRIYDNNASHELRVFLGIDEKTNKATMQLYSANGEKSLVLSEEGIYNCYQISDRDSFDYYNPFETNFYIPYTLNSTFEARIIVDLQKFRAYSKSANSTKIDLTTTSGSGDINVNINGVSGGAGGVGVSSSGTSVAWGQGGKHTSEAYGEDGNVHLESHTHWVNLLHDHSVTVNSSPHSHPITLSGTASANDHSHGITMPSHGHDLVYGIYETDYFPTCEVWIGNNLVATLNDGTRRVDVDITKQFKLLNKGSNKITIKTPNGNELGRASFTLFWSGFYTYY